MADEGKQAETGAAEPDDSEPTPERQAELREAYSSNLKLGKPPYAGVVIGSRGELQWILRERDWTPSLWTDLLGQERERINLSCACLAGAELSGIDLRGADLRKADLRKTSLVRAELSGADCSDANMAGVGLADAHLWLATLRNTDLSRADMTAVRVVGADLSGADLSEATLVRAELSSPGVFKIQAGATTRLSLSGRTILHNVDLSRSDLTNADLGDADLTGAKLTQVVMDEANVLGADLTGVTLQEARCRSACFRATNLSGTCLEGANLRGADLRSAVMDTATELAHIMLDNRTLLADIIWNAVPLTQVDWTQVPTLGDDFVAQQRMQEPWEQPDRMRKAAASLEADLGTPVQLVGVNHIPSRTATLDRAVRANRQLALALRQQGLSEQADRFAYQAQVLQRQVLRWQRKWGQWGVQTALAVLAGYGYRLWRILAAYSAVLLVFTVVYWLMGVHSFSHEPGWQALWDSFLVSLSAIHGRTMFEQLGAWSAAAWVAAIESVVGIVIEGVFVAILVQRFFGGR